MSVTLIIAWISGVTTVATAITAMIIAISKALTTGATALAQIKTMNGRMDDHSRRITEVGKEVTQVALQVKPSGNT